MRIKLLIGFVVFLGLLLFPLAGAEGYYYRTLSTIFLWVGLASAWNLTSGFTGYIDFGAVGYFGIGNYATALLMTRAGIPFFPSIMISGLLSGLLALFIGRYTMRLRGRIFRDRDPRLCGGGQTDCP